MLLKMLYNHSYTRVDLSWYFSYLYRSSIVMSIRPLKFFAWLRCCLQCLVAVRLSTSPSSLWQRLANRIFQRPLCFSDLVLRPELSYRCEHLELNSTFKMMDTIKPP